jgi:S1-C subfamily serine protease
MFTTLKTRVLTGAMLLLAGLLATGASAADGFQVRLRPSYPSQPTAPRLGFSGHFDYGHGMHVDRVSWGSQASRIGLERGDVIVAVDGQRLRSLNHYYGLLQHSGSRVTLHIEDGRTGRVVARVARLDNGHDHDHGHHHGSQVAAFDF